MTTTMDMVRARTLNLADLEGLGFRVAHAAIEATAAVHPVAGYVGDLFRAHIAKAATEMLATVSRHERSMVNLVIKEHQENSGQGAAVADAISADLGAAWGKGLDAPAANEGGGT